MRIVPGRPRGLSDNLRPMWYPADVHLQFLWTLSFLSAKFPRQYLRYTSLALPVSCAAGPTAVHNFAAFRGLLSNGGYFMSRNFLGLTTVAFLLSAGSLLAQSSPSSSGSATSQPTRTRQEPCWQQAGISNSVFEQRQAIERDAHSQVSSVCADTSLTPQQKLARVREIRHQAQQKTGELITPDQEKALMACREQRNANPPGAGRREGGNPCAEWQGARGNGTNGNIGGNSGEGTSSSPQH